MIKNIGEKISDITNRLFAVIYIHNKQFKVSQDDIIHLEGNICLDVGEEIKIEKVNFYFLFLIILNFLVYFNNVLLKISN